MRPIKKLLWVSDVHACWTESLEESERLSWLAHFIAKEKPDIIIFGGDFWDNPGLNGHKGSTLLPIPGKEAPAKAAELDTYRDMDAGKEAIRRILGVYRNDNERHRRAGHKEREYLPEIYFLEGNHEEFWTRYKTKHPSQKSSPITNRSAVEFINGMGIEWVPAREKLILGGVAFRHFHPDMRGQLCRQYGIPVTRETVLSHAEVQPTLKVQQRGKWDICWLPGMSGPADPVKVGDILRARITAAMGAAK